MSNLSISMKTPSRDLEKSPIDRAITVLAAGLAKEKRVGALPAGPALDLAFLLSSAQDSPDFTGMRMGGFTSDEKTLYFEVAVPQTMGFSHQASRYVAAVVQDMVDNAASYFDELAVPFDARQWHQALTPMLTALTSGAMLH